MDSDMEKKSLEITAMFKATFETEVGKRCLKHLEKTFCDREIAPDGADLLVIGKRQGASNAIRQIIKEVQSGR